MASHPYWSPAFSEGKEVNVAEALMKQCREEEENITNLAAAKELARILTFDKFDEDISFDVLRGIALVDYPIYIERVCNTFSIPSDAVKSLLAAHFADYFTQKVIHMNFSPGKSGSYIYGQFTVNRRGDKIDIAHALYTLKFKIAPTVIRREQELKFLSFNVGTRVWHDSEERVLSRTDEDHLKNFFLIKAITAFRSEYAGEIGAWRLQSRTKVMQSSG